MNRFGLVFPGKKVFLVTGGAGFIGSNLCEALLQLGQQVKCFDNLSTGYFSNVQDFMNNSNFEFILGDIRDFSQCAEAVKNVDYVLHQAAWGSVPRSIEFPLMYETINVGGTLNMMKASSDANVERFVFASSSSVYGDSVALPKREGEEGNVLSPYALTKKTNEEYGRLFFNLYNLKTVGLRYFNVFGKRQNPKGAYAAVIPKFISSFVNNVDCNIFGDGEQARDFTYIENVVYANLLACLSNESALGESINVAAGGKITINEIFNYIASYFGSNRKPNYLPERKGDVRYSNADISRAGESLNYKPLISFEEGIKLTLEWYTNDD